MKLSKKDLDYIYSDEFLSNLDGYDNNTSKNFYKFKLCTDYTSEFDDNSLKFIDYCKSKISDLICYKYIGLWGGELREYHMFYSKHYDIIISFDFDNNIYVNKVSSPEDFMNMSIEFDMADSNDAGELDYVFKVKDIDNVSLITSRLVEASVSKLNDAKEKLNSVLGINEAINLKSFNDFKNSIK